MNKPASNSVEIQALLDAAVDGVILIDGRGRIEVFNHAAERLLGYSEQEALGKNVSMLMAAEDGAKHDGYLERFHRTGVAHIIGIGREVMARRKDGSLLPVLLSVGRISQSDPPRYVGFLQDQTQRHQAMSAIMRERDRANRYLEIAQTILVALDVDGYVTLVNRSACDVLAHSEARFLGMDWFESIVPDEERSAARAQFAEFVSSDARRPCLAEYHVRAGGGQTRLIAWRCILVQDESGIVTGVLCSGEDITDERRAQAEAQRARERMMQVSRLATMGEMTSGISHELNQPLAAITSFAQAGVRLLARPDPDLPEIREALKLIADQALRAGGVIHQLRRLVSNGEASREPCDLNALIRDVSLLLEADSRATKVRIEFDAGPGIPLVELDPTQIQLVLLNLLRNAVQALETAPDRRIIVSTRAAAGVVEVRVRDTGPGVPASMVHDLFQPFATTRANGTGLGLATSRRIVESHSGTLQYEPEEHGACFIFRLPINEGVQQ